MIVEDFLPLHFVNHPSSDISTCPQWDLPIQMTDRFLCKAMLGINHLATSQKSLAGLPLVSPHPHCVGNYMSTLTD